MTALLQLPKYRKIPGVNQWMNEYTNYNTYNIILYYIIHRIHRIHRILVSHEKGMKY